MRLANDDIMSGSVIGIQKNAIKIKTSFAEVDIPLDRVGLIQFANKNAVAKEKLPKGMVSARLKGHGSLTFRLKSWQDGKLEVESPDFGAATLDGSIVESITFNPSKKRALGSKGTLSKKELKKRLRGKEKGNIGPPPPRVPK